MAWTGAEAQRDRASVIKPNHVKRVLPDIDADYGDGSRCYRGHGVLIVWVPRASILLAEWEHGRTIPLAVFGSL